MKSKKIPADIKSKSIKEAQNEIKEIINSLENSDETNLEASKDKYTRMLELNNHIQQEFKKELKEINSSLSNKRKKTNKN